MPGISEDAALRTDRRSPAPLWHYLVLSSIPGLLMLLNRNWPFIGIHATDPWYYFGGWLHFPRLHNLLFKYPGERILWVAPGYWLVHWFGPIAGAVILHWLVYAATLILFYYILRRLTDTRTAFAGAMMLGCNSFFIGSQGWDYPEGLQMVCLLLSLAPLVRFAGEPQPGWKAYAISGVAYCGLLHLYPGWLLLAPGLLFVMVRRAVAGGPWFRRVLMAGAAALGGAVVMFFGLWALYAAMGGKGFYFKISLLTALQIAQSGNTPWLNPEWWVKPLWLMFPAMGAVMAVIGLVDARRRPQPSTPFRVDLFVCYLAWAVVLAWNTMGVGKLLAFDYKTSILMPGAFLSMAVVCFRVPRTTPAWLFYPIAILASVACAVPLARLDLYMVADHAGLRLVLVALILGLAAARLLWRIRGTVWAAGLVLFAVLSFGAIPASTGTPWMSAYDGAELSRAVARAVDVVLSRTPVNEYPTFFYHNLGGRWCSEFRAVMCAMYTIWESMLEYPKVDKRFPVGTRLFLLREQASGEVAAEYVLARAGLPVEARSRDRVPYGEESFSVIQLQVVPLTLEAVRRNFDAIGERRLQAGDFSAVPAAPGRCRYSVGKPFVAERTAVYQFELHHPKCDGLRLGALAGDGAAEWVERSGTAVPQADGEVSWFRVEAVEGRPVRLAVEMDCGAGCGTVLSGSTLAVRRDRRLDVAAFAENLGRRLKVNLIPNGSFEVGLFGWSGMRGKIRQGSTCHAGSCVEFLPDGEVQQYLVRWQATTLQPGKQYRLTAWLRSGGRKPVRIEFGMWDSDRNVWVGKQPVTAELQWTRVESIFTCDTANVLSPIFWQDRGEFGPMLVDEVELEEVAVAKK